MVKAEDTSLAVPTLISYIAEDQTDVIYNWRCKIDSAELRRLLKSIRSGVVPPLTGEHDAAPAPADGASDVRRVAAGRQ